MNPNEEKTEVFFDFGPTSSYGETISAGEVEGGTVDMPVKQLLRRLSCGTTYHFRARAQNIIGTGYGDDEFFATTPCCSQEDPEDCIFSDGFESGRTSAWSRPVPPKTVE